jgi:transcriptional regulator NrdR family protein
MAREGDGRRLPCERCGAESTRVRETTARVRSASIRRRRECLECGHRFTTTETIVARKIETTPQIRPTTSVKRAKLLPSMRLNLKAAIVTSVHRTSRRVALASGMSERKISDVIAGVVTPTDIEARLICDELGVDYDDPNAVAALFRDDRHSAGAVEHAMRDVSPRRD